MSKKYNYGPAMFLGTTTRGVEMPFFFDLHTSVFNSKPPGIVITGQPGSGKTYLSMCLATISAIMGKTTVIFDFKGDFLSLTNLEDQVGKVNLWNLGDPRQKGVLDPFRMSKDPGEQLDLALTLIEIFLGGITGAQRTALAPVVKDVIQGPNPSLGKVVHTLRESRRSEARDLGTSLDLISRLPFASLCFAPAGKPLESVTIGQGMTIIAAIGMEPPKEGNTDNKSRLVTGILYLLTDFIRRIMLNDMSGNPKTLIIDEAWALLSIPAGAQVVKEVALLGRSKSVALVLSTQNDKHLEHLDIDSTVSTRFAFQSSPEEAERLVKSMRLPEGEQFDDLILSLSQGECLVKDILGRYASVQISNWRQDWNEAFETNPLERLAISDRNKNK